MKRLLLLVCLLGFGTTAAGGEVAITIDDLPRGGDSTERDLETVRAMTAKLLLPFRDERIPVIGRNEGRAVDFGPEGLREVLELWLDAGADLGNHSYSHLNVNNVPLAEFTADIARGEPLVETALAARGRSLRYFATPRSRPDAGDQDRSASVPRRARLRRRARDARQRGLHVRGAVHDPQIP
jgi:peptidoglycan/xylan/chitin deacetylase (PgdA/CDA1 family)